MVMRALKMSPLSTGGRKPQPVPRRYGSDAFYLNHFAAVVIAAGRADVMWPLQFAAIRAFVVRARNQSMVGPAHIAPGARDLGLWDGHGFNFRVRGSYLARLLDNIRRSGKPDPAAPLNSLAPLD